MIVDDLYQSNHTYHVQNLSCLSDCLASHPKISPAQFENQQTIFINIYIYSESKPTLVRWVVSQAPIVYLNQPWFAGWSARLLLYTPTNPGSLGGQLGSYYIPQPTLVHWVVRQAPIVYPSQPWFVGWSARSLLYTPASG